MFNEHSSEGSSVLDQCETVALRLSGGDVVFAWHRVWS